MAHVVHETHPEIVNRLKRAEGHLRKTIAMIEARRTPGPGPATARHREGGRRRQKDPDPRPYRSLPGPCGRGWFARSPSGACRAFGSGRGRRGPGSERRMQGLDQGMDQLIFQLGDQHRRAVV